MKLRLLLGMLVVGMASACGGGGEGGGNGGGGGGGGGGGESGGPIAMKLEEQNGSGKTASVNLEPGIGTTEMTLEITPQRGTDQAAIHVHKGSCGDISAETAVEHDVGFVTAGLGQGSIFVPLSDIATGEYVIDVHDPRNEGDLFACGQIPEQ